MSNVLESMSLCGVNPYIFLEAEKCFFSGTDPTGHFEENCMFYIFWGIW